MSDRLLIAAERSGDAMRTLRVHPMRPGDAVTVGRQAEIVLGADPPDGLVSRLAMTIACTPGGWSVSTANRNGTLIRPWGLPAWQSHASEVVSEPLVALRVLGSPSREHWILLQDDSRSDTQSGDAEPPMATLATHQVTAPRPLTPAQLEAVLLLFGDLLAWPPATTAAPAQLKQVARSLGVSISAVQERLKAVVAKATALGLSREVEVTDPEYVYVLVRAGYLRPFHAIGRSGAAG